MSVNLPPHKRLDGIEKRLEYLEARAAFYDSCEETEDKAPTPCDERKLSDISNELHNLACEMHHDQDDDQSEWSSQLSKLAAELWHWNPQLPESSDDERLVAEFERHQQGQEPISVIWKRFDELEKAQAELKRAHEEIIRRDHRISDLVEELERLNYDADANKASAAMFRLRLREWREIIRLSLDKGSNPAWLRLRLERIEGEIIREMGA